MSNARHCEIDTSVVFRGARRCSYSQTDGNGELTQYITTTPTLLGCKIGFSTSLLANLTMDTLIKKTAHTSRGFTYTYSVSRASAGKSTILLLHGWPDHAAMSEGLAVKHLVPAGYGLIIPDCLGYGDSSKPTDSWRTTRYA
jgi:pimeloyl-ACP methyl ester carboxylesterase